MNSSANNSCIPLQAVAGKGMFIAGLRVFVLFLALLIRESLYMDWVTNAQGLVAYTLLLMGYLCVEARNLRTRDTSYFWINPVVLASLFTFMMAFGFTNILYFMPTELVAKVGLQPIATPWMNHLMLLVVLGACAMWVGYSSGLGRRMGLMLQQSPLLCKWMSPSMRVNSRVLYVCLAISLIARLWEIRLGVYGYSSTYDRLMEGAAYRQYLFIAESLGKLALVVLAMQCFARPHLCIRDCLLLGLVLGYEVAFGFLIGLKGSVIMPLIIVGFAYYSQRRRFPLWLVPAIAIGVTAAYAVIEPFRSARNRDTEFDGTSLSYIATTMTDARADEVSEGIERTAIWLRFLARMNMVYYASQGIEYAARNTLPKDSPAFLGDILLAPVHAVVPRILWNSKPIQQCGFWYTLVVMGNANYTSTAMTPVTYLNFAGGSLAVILGFIFVGILQRGFFDGLLHFGSGGLIVLLGLLGTLADIDSSFNNVIVEVIRLVPMLIVAQYVFLHRERSCVVTPARGGGGR